MKHIVWLLKWILKAAIFFTLFAFALNNQQDTIVHFFFGTQWRAPQVLVVLIAFTAGVVVGVLGMLPRWWKQRQAAAVTATNTEPSAVSPLQSARPHGL
jgi:uncharacterized integral membrane protein